MLVAAVMQIPSLAAIQRRRQRLTIPFRDGIITYTRESPEIFILGVGGLMLQFLSSVWSDEQGQDIAEYAVMLAVILVLVIGTVRLVGGNANNAFSTVANTLQPQ
jgi:Flp pilus assembly pilin Flp